MTAAPTTKAVVLAATGIPVAVFAVLVRPDAWVLGLLWPLFISALTVIDGLIGAARLNPQLVSLPTVSLEIGRPAEISFPLVRRVPDLLAELETSRWLHADRVTEPGENPVFHLKAMRRGMRTIDALHLRWAGPLGLAAHVRRLALDLDVPVTVDLGTVREETLTLTAEGLIGETEQQRRGAGSEFDALRTFTYGMDHRAIDWKHSARHRDLVAREMRDEQNQAVAIVIDSGRTMTETASSGGLSRLDHAVTSGLLTAFVALKRGDAAAFYAIDNKPRVRTGLALGTRSFPKITAAAASVEYTSHETNFTLGLSEVATSLKRRSLIVCFTEIVDPTSAQLMIESTQRLLKNHYVLFVVLRDAEVEQVAAKEPDTADDVGRAVVARTLLKTRREVFAKLRHIGVEVLEVDAEESAPRVVRRYLEIKKRGLL